MYLIEWLGNIPNVVWSGVIASGLTLSGVLISNRSNTARLRLQLVHDAAERERDRKATLRREVYLHAVQEINKINHMLGSLPSTDLTATSTAAEVSMAFQKFGGAIFQLSLVSNLETAFVANELVAMYVELLPTITSRIMSMQNIQREIAAKNDYLYRIQAEIGRISVAGDEMNAQGGVQEDFLWTRQTIVDYQNKLNTVTTEIEKLRKRHNSLVMEFWRYLFRNLKDMGPQQVRVLVALRRKFGMEADFDTALQHMEAIRERAASHMESVLAELSTEQGRGDSNH